MNQKMKIKKMKLNKFILIMIMRFIMNMILKHNYIMKLESASQNNKDHILTLNLMIY